MSKDKIADYDGTTAGNNTDIGGISIAEGMLPSAVNNSMRELTKQLGAFANGTDAIDALDVTGAATVGGAFTSPGIDDNADATAITIDSSENVLVGKTATNYQSVGIEAKGNGSLWGTADGNNPLILVRKSSNGAVAQFYKDTTKAGSIGVRSGNLQIGTDDVGLEFHDTDNTIYPANVTTQALPDGTITLGAAASRFNNLYLSGGVYLGGTGSANLLSDYETGTFTATSSVGTISSGFASYTKVGDLVTVQVVVSNFSDRTNTSGIGIGGLPFTSSSNNVSTQGILAQYVNTGGDAVVAYLGVNSSTISFYTTNQNSGYGLVGYNDLSSTAAEFYIQLSYKT